MALDFREDLKEFWPEHIKRYSKMVRIKNNIRTPTVLISNEFFIKQGGEQSQVSICVDFI